uniref:E3 ubiquitin-protein ligase n=1 Tax=Panagrellus redivivus TaxID=6233 RepID=A0A7E4V4P7_PANRE
MYSTSKVDFCGVAFSFHAGDIATFDADTAVVFSDPQFQMRDGAARAILDRGGGPFREAYEKARTTNTLCYVDIDVSGVDTLPFKSVIVLSVCARRVLFSMRQLYLAALLDAIVKGHKRLVMPLMTSDIQDADCNLLQEADLLKEVVTMFSQSQQMQSISIIDRSRRMIDAFRDVFGGVLTSRMSFTPIVLDVVVPQAVHEDNNWKKVDRSGLPTAGTSANDILANECPVCLYDLAMSHLGSSDSADLKADPVVQLTNCIHKFHQTCIKQCFETKKQCPMCLRMYDKTFGNQPAHCRMRVINVPGRVPGNHRADGWFRIKYLIPGGIQTEGHVRPGLPHSGGTRSAWVPNDEGGREVLELLQKAFDQRHIFTIGDSVLTDQQNVPVWAICHNTSQLVDPAYYNRVKEQLARVGITADK